MWRITFRLLIRILASWLVCHINVVWLRLKLLLIQFRLPSCSLIHAMFINNIHWLLIIYWWYLTSLIKSSWSTTLITFIHGWQGASSNTTWASSKIAYNRLEARIRHTLSLVRKVRNTTVCIAIMGWICCFSYELL